MSNHIQPMKEDFMILNLLAEMFEIQGTLSSVLRHLKIQCCDLFRKVQYTVFTSSPENLEKLHGS